MSTTVMGVTVQNWLAAGAVVAVTVGLFVVMARIQRVAVRRVMIRAYTADMIRRVLMAIMAAVAVVYIFGLLELEVGPLLGGLGISGLIVAVALQPMFANFVGSIILHSTRAFRPGDEIESNGFAGTVVDISHRAVQLEDFDGNSVYIPNMRVLDSTLVNLTAESPRRSCIRFQVAYDTDLRAAVQLVGSSVAAIDGVAARPPVEVLVRDFADSGVALEAYLWHPSAEAVARRVVGEAAITIREALAASGITIPFPQVVLRRPRPANAQPPGVDPGSPAGPGSGSASS